MGVRFACGDRVHVAVTLCRESNEPAFHPRDEKGEEKGGRAARNEEEGGTGPSSCRAPLNRG